VTCFKRLINNFNNKPLTSKAKESLELLIFSISFKVSILELPNKDIFILLLLVEAKEEEDNKFKEEVLSLELSLLSFYLLIILVNLTKLTF
jgi:hypothetical protein